MKLKLRFLELDGLATRKTNKKNTQPLALLTLGPAKIGTQEKDAAKPKAQFSFLEWPINAKKKESISASTHANVLRAKESFHITTANFKARMVESNATKQDGVGPYQFQVILIEEGMGNMRDAYFYTKDALKMAVPSFDGKKCFANHPTEKEETERPERDVRDIIGHFENVRYEESKDDGRGRLMADLNILTTDYYKWARELIFESVEYSKKYPERPLIGLSINAAGEAEPTPITQVISDNSVSESIKPKLIDAQTKGIEEVKIVTAITDAVSVDLVTEAGAGGKILSVIH